MTEEQLVEKEFRLEDPQQSVALLGTHDKYIKLLEESEEVVVKPFGEIIKISGSSEAVDKTIAILKQLSELLSQGVAVSSTDVLSAIKMANRGTLTYFQDLYTDILLRDQKKKPIRVKNYGQRQYVQAITNNDLVFGIGPAGTGKTFLAVVMAVAALKKNKVERIILTRPAVEAGESLGFLPGDLKEKVDPYLRPVYDALYSVLGKEHTERLLDRGVIEIAPLAYMRGRTLENAFVILDEAQNTTRAQMKMFLTRLGFGSKMVVNGDKTQIDLPKGHSQSGLIDAEKILVGRPHISFVNFDAADIVRHPVVAEIIDAYSKQGEEEG
ncbi:PhoH family protein [Liquorilactobacillus mali]|uniref:PhoH-like protein n=2 Tax=Liquorilactobacillus mali TaxID=1618 RepID=J1F206_9LACO|nr:PhoH family protein [Liquorilactobacillus mali]EJE98579.1 phosphate starvation-inducible protein [Liquorilactobacillus mali KCTC 3596 = DSM 20444]KRN08571.1 phosphate starvation-inducible protein [Liquorilactobacillus mali KCTC 3596 = DSM 20444]KRN30400.1 phosphate starvation-inducible protein [Liquorilactobacillus mali]MDC7952132.1 PhoH family protein [Liquorilactobacillus mali]MDN7144654.1 PhoH family protein [Liquorilactobacillus mali]